jgi:hypothetical protein
MFYSSNNFLLTLNIVAHWDLCRRWFRSLGDTARLIRKLEMRLSFYRYEVLLTFEVKPGHETEYWLHKPIKYDATLPGSLFRRILSVEGEIRGVIIDGGVDGLSGGDYIHVGNIIRE